jgi:hypothetical protein
MPITSIGDYAFSGLYGLTSVTIPDGVTNIAEGAFDTCLDLTNAAIPGSVIAIGYAAFSSSGLTSVAIPGRVSNIGQGAFGGCDNLTNVTIGFGVSYIVSNMFGGCPSLARATIPGSVTNIGDYAFSGCTDLTQVYFTGNAPVVDQTTFQDYRMVDEGDVPYYVTTAYYLPGTTGWAEFSSNTYIPTNMVVPAVLWNPVIRTSGASFGVQSNQFGFNITGTTNIPIVVEACTSLAQPVWVPLQSMTLTNGLVHFSEPIETNAAARFYRIGAP